MFLYGAVVQRIGRGPAKTEIQVRFLAVPKISLTFVRDFFIVTKKRIYSQKIWRNDASCLYLDSICILSITCSNDTFHIWSSGSPRTTHRRECGRMGPDVTECIFVIIVFHRRMTCWSRKNTTTRKKISRKAYNTISFGSNAFGVSSA